MIFLFSWASKKSEPQEEPESQKKPELQEVGKVLKLKAIPGKEEKKILLIENGKEKGLDFESNKDNCFNILLLLAENKDKFMFCGEIIHTAGDDALLPGCSFDGKDGCSEKKSQCHSYNTLNNHRIGVIKKMLEENKIGTIKNSGKRESRWKLKLNPEIDDIVTT